jgi:hypothetical protein
MKGLQRMLKDRFAMVAGLY